ncbi:MAG: chorismate lyase [Magnetococcales bacterium]|nr:chorismate lyase [Magnetococcales bacterium]
MNVAGAHADPLAALCILEDWRGSALLVDSPGPFLALDTTMRRALVCEESLTRHLESLLGHPLRVRLEGQAFRPAGFEAPNLWGAAYRLPTGDPILVRDAWLGVGQRDLIFAHSEMVLTGIAPEARDAVERGEEPLGSLFQELEGAVRRESLELTRVAAPMLAGHIGAPSDQAFWCRRSLFLTGVTLRARILEVFLGTWAHASPGKPTPRTTGINQG